MLDDLRSVIGAIEAVTETVGRAGALVMPLLIVVVVVNVALRYGFGLGLIELEELQWHLNAITVMLCLAYALKHDAHVRVDILHSALSPRQKSWVNLIGAVTLLIPFCIGIAWFAWGNAAYSWRIGEGSPMPSGLPARYLVKFLMFGGFVLLLAQAVAMAGRSLLVIIGAETEERP
ncbi:MULTISPECIES: TRAP transporter small permease subunit [unclassified Roseitalea]|uniref:TRAP transporter small permease subunit n=1 Tax=unclassified Roseitalea TaxID=2639107 RepID=UPI00273F5775|nr:MULTISPECIES: TRAP transporter small permease subunit [unclassified Roseitalea]